MQAKGGKPRRIAVRTIPGLQALIDRLRKTMEQYAATPPGQRRRHSKPDFVFWWVDATDPRQVFNEAKKALGLGKDGRTLHTMRGSAEWWWENSLCWDDQMICDVAGHTSRARRAHYRAAPTVEELEARLALRVSPT
jgi:hypothetical protein